MATCEFVKELFTNDAAAIVFEDSEAPDEIIGTENVFVPVKVLFNPNIDVPLMLFAYPTVANSLLFTPLFGPSVVVGYAPLNVALF